MNKVIILSIVLCTSVGLHAADEVPKKTVRSVATPENIDLAKKYGIQLGKSGNINWLSPNTALFLALNNISETRDIEKKWTMIEEWAKDHNANEDTLMALESAFDASFAPKQRPS